MTIDRTPVRHALRQPESYGQTEKTREPSFQERQHMREIEEMIAAGLGSTPQPKIPANWREERGPDKRCGI